MKAKKVPTSLLDTFVEDCSRIIRQRRSKALQEHKEALLKEALQLLPEVEAE